MASDDDPDTAFDKALQTRAKEMMRAHRESKGWNQETMAGFVGASKSNYQKYELPQKDGGEKRNVPLRVIYRFCDRANVDLHYMLSGRKSSSSRKVS